MLEHVLGSGASGVVYSALDPLLERRVALKLLRQVTPSSVERERLWREARTMARLSHSNVVTVHEVGTARGRDFVAMELVHGVSLATWLRGTRPTWKVVLEVFLAAGRGLAAAHAAGIVHRDFKPHNVLRGDDGRIMVTDFGIARDVTVAGGRSERLEQSTLSRLTSTGALLGTPVYMAAEQWTGGEVTAATDQFAFCVALWEALCGERPYGGQTLEGLRANVLRGPVGVDASRVGRRLRGVLLRGLEPDPARRWPSMQVLLANLERVRRRTQVRPWLVGGVTSVAAMVAGVWLVTTQDGKAAATVCQPPARDVTSVWSLAISTQMRAATSTDHADVLESAYRDWHDTRETACQAPVPVRAAQLSCLDGVLDRIDILRQAFQRVPTSSSEWLKKQIVNAALCRQPNMVDVPKLTLKPTEDVIRAYELRAGWTEKRDRALSLFDGSGASPCARIVAALSLPPSSVDAQRRARMEIAMGLIEQCGDDRLRAEVLIASIDDAGNAVDQAVEKAEAAERRVSQPDLDAELSRKRVWVETSHRPAAMQLPKRNVDGVAASDQEMGHLLNVVAQARVRLNRSMPDDLETVTHDAWMWDSRAQSSQAGRELDRQLYGLAAAARFRLGDVAVAHWQMVYAWQIQSPSERIGGRAVRGKVVDRHGQPVAGAMIAARSKLMADEAAVGLPALDRNVRDDDLRVTRSDASGQFVIRDAGPAGVIAAQLGDERSSPMRLTDRVQLVLEPTRRLEGSVDLGGVPFSLAHLEVVADDDHTGRYRYMAPVARDGSFTLTGVTTHALRLSIIVRVRGGEAPERRADRIYIPGSLHSVSGLHLRAVRSNRSLDVLVHPPVFSVLRLANVSLLSGDVPIRTYEDLLAEKASSSDNSSTQPTSRPRDFLAHFENAPVGDVTVCGRSSDDNEESSLQQADHLVVRCTHASPNDTMVELWLPDDPLVP